MVLVGPAPLQGEAWRPVCGHRYHAPGHSHGFLVTSEWPSIAIPDDQNVTMVHSFEVTGHGPNAVIGSAADLPLVCIELEHSFMADLLISLACPNGQSVVFTNKGGHVPGGLDERPAHRPR